jgi:hypothetical protein
MVAHDPEPELIEMVSSPALICVQYMIFKVAGQESRIPQDPDDTSKV